MELSVYIIWSRKSGVYELPMRSVLDPPVSSA
uniref:Uncharacterized protein n=1 Tax=Setaria viridis TaxID=4556 RepID=A0A4U6TJ67_SETVI|nr:hypothetical protein SEVIR_8G146966v2 [Setaria viridis]